MIYFCSLYVIIVGQKLSYMSIILPVNAGIFPDIVTRVREFRAAPDVGLAPLVQLRASLERWILSGPEQLFLP